MQGARIDICVNTREGGITTNMGENAATVRCWDEDPGNPDDAMTGTVSTDANGCATLSYSKKSPKWYNPCRGWDCAPYSNPDIYCIVTTSSNYYHTLYTDTKGGHNQNHPANFGSVTLYPDRVRRGDPGTTNGCGPASNWDGVNDVADFLTGFADQCNNHDLCYNSCEETQRDCDIEFRDLMYSQCNDVHDAVTLQELCKAVADGMYAIVREYGAESFEEGQIKFGCRD